MRKPLASIFELIAPVKLRLVASGLIIENVRCIVMKYPQKILQIVTFILANFNEIILINLLLLLVYSKLVKKKTSIYVLLEFI
jgi:hypothetical protein